MPPLVPRLLLGGSHGRPSDQGRQVLSLVRAGLREFVFPSACAGCGRTGSLLCGVCRPGDPPFDVPVHGLAVTAAARYDGGLRTALLAYKERDRRDLAEPLGVALCGAASCMGGVLVPVPSAPDAARRRGGDHVRRLALVAARHTGRRAVPALAVRRAVRDSAGLGVEDRRHNLRGAFVAAPPPRPHTPAVVVDDIVTTGATLGEAARALRLAGWAVSGAAVVAATPRHGSYGDAATPRHGSYGDAATPRRRTADPLAGPR